MTWRSLAEVCHRYLAKGRLVAVSGRMQVRTYDDNAGQRRYITEVVADEVQLWRGVPLPINLKGRLRIRYRILIPAGPMGLIPWKMMTFHFK